MEWVEHLEKNVKLTKCCIRTFAAGLMHGNFGPGMTDGRRGFSLFSTSPPQTSGPISVSLLLPGALWSTEPLAPHALRLSLLAQGDRVAADRNV